MQGLQQHDLERLKGFSARCLRQQRNSGIGATPDASPHGSLHPDPLGWRYAAAQISEFQRDGSPY